MTIKIYLIWLNTKTKLRTHQKKKKNVNKHGMHYYITGPLYGT